MFLSLAQFSVLNFGYVYVCADVWRRPEVNVGCCSLSNVYICFETESLTGLTGLEFTK